MLRKRTTKREDPFKSKKPEPVLFSTICKESQHLLEKKQFSEALENWQTWALRSAGLAQLFLIQKLNSE